MKKILLILLCFNLIIFTGCTSSKKSQIPAPKPPAESDTAHLSVEDKGIVVSVSKEVRNMTQMIKPDKSGFDVVSVLVKIENNSTTKVMVSPDFVTLKTDDGKEYKYAAALTAGSPLGKSAFSKRPIPPEYRGGGLLLFEIVAGTKAESLIYKDDSGHFVTLKFQTGTKSNV